MSAYEAARVRAREREAEHGRRCVRCNQDKPADAFYVDPRAKRLLSWCKACMIARKAERYRNEPAFRLRTLADTKASQARRRARKAAEGTS